MAGLAGTHLFISGVRRAPASITNRRDMHPRQCPKQPFGAPKTTQTENNLLHGFGKGWRHLCAKNSMIAAGKNWQMPTRQIFIIARHAGFEWIIEKHAGLFLMSARPSVLHPVSAVARRQRRAGFYPQAIQ